MLKINLQVKTKMWYNISNLVTWLYIYGYRDEAIAVTELEQYISGCERKYVGL